jgi:hypothetical protein
MKKQILLLIAVVISSLSIAQSNPSFGIRAGVISAGMRGDAVSNLKDLLDFTDGMITTADRTGFFAGGYATIPLGNVLSVEPALYYSQKGYELRGELGIKGLSFLGANAKAKLNSQYIDVPVVLKANFDGFEVFAGPQISYLAKANLRSTAGVFGINLLNNRMNASDQFNKWDAGVTGGVGYKFNNGINLRASYEHGLSRVDANENMNSYNHAFRFGVGFNF